MITKNSMSLFLISLVEVMTIMRYAGGDEQEQPITYKCVTVKCYSTSLDILISALATSPVFLLISLLPPLVPV